MTQVRGIFEHPDYPVRARAADRYAAVRALGNPPHLDADAVVVYDGEGGGTYTVPTSARPASPLFARRDLTERELLDPALFDRAEYDRR